MKDNPALMEWFVLIAWLLILTEALFTLMVFNNYRFALGKYNSSKRGYRPRVALVIPCKDIDAGFQQNIESFYRQDYEDFLLWFVVSDSRDPAYGELVKIRQRLAASSKARAVEVLVSGTGQACSQKIHNLLYAAQRVPGDVEVLAFADSDVFARPQWLGLLLQRLRLEKIGATTGYRWFIPEKNNFATLALSAVNAKIAQLMGNTIFNQAWGGSMAIRVKTFKQLGLAQIWQKAVSDDLSLGCAVKGAGKKVEFVPGCLVATRESTTWPKLFEFARRQFIITKVAAPKTWLLGLLGCVHSLAGLWGMSALAIYSVVNHLSHVRLFTAVAVMFLTIQLATAILRQILAYKLFTQDWPKLKLAAVVDIALFWLWSWLMLVLILSSAFGRTITWRGIRYKLLGPAETVVLKS